MPVQDACHCCFFFQAEDGIRDYKVTGVQTCALPICVGPHRGRSTRARGRARQDQRPGRQHLPSAVRLRLHGGPRRSEERRVGKECRARWRAKAETKEAQKEWEDRWEKRT